MSNKLALLIGVSEYGEGIPSLSAPLNDVAAMQQVLENPEMAGFDEVEPLINPDPIAMQLAVQQIFDNRHKDDLVLLFFSGHGITDDNNRLYLAAKGTSKDVYQATSVPATFIHNRSLESYAKRQVIILDCCYSGAFAEGWQSKSVGLDLKKELGAEGRIVLTSSTATQTSFQQEGEKLSLYTQYIVEGMETGAADREGNGKIYAHELHNYAKAKVQEVKPKQKPDIITDKEGFGIILSQAPVDDPELKYRKLVEIYASEGQITVAGNSILRVKQQELGITDEKSNKIINEVLAPYRKRLKNIKFYKETFREAVEKNYPLNERLLKELQDLQDILGLEDKDVAEIQEPILAEKKVEAPNPQEEKVQQHEQEDYENKLQQQEQEFLKTDQELEDNLTFEEAGIQDNDKLLLFSPNAQKIKPPQEGNQPPVNPPTSPSPNSSKSSSSRNWLIAVITGSVMGILIMIAIAFSRLLPLLRSTTEINPERKEVTEEIKTNATVAGKSGIKNIRSGAGTVHGVVGTISIGSRVKILSKKQDRGGYLWYEIYHPSSGTQGWIAAHLISID